jgi:2-hydroxycyclohexanecarboxyl-CoA dehydrogenase
MTKVALVTGGAAGIGRAISVRLAREDIAIGVLDLEPKRAQGTVDIITEAGGQATALGADISQRGEVGEAVGQLRETFGPVKIVVNNAGISGYTDFLELTDEQWDRTMAVNLKGTFIVTQTVIPDMIEAKWGRIVNISSSSAQSGAPLMADYSASKGGVIALTKSLAQEFGAYNITCNNIPPRFVMNTIMSEESPWAAADLDVRESIIKAGPIQRQGEPEDIAGACAYLVSDEAGYVTGQTIGVNGGRYI